MYNSYSYIRKLIDDANKRKMLTGELSDIGKIQELSRGTVDPKIVRKVLVLLSLNKHW